MKKRSFVISRISGELRALVKGKGWMALNKINPNEQVAAHAEGKIEWVPFNKNSVKAKRREEQQQLLAEGYANDLY